MPTHERNRLTDDEIRIMQSAVKALDALAAELRQAIATQNAARLSRLIRAMMHAGYGLVELDKLTDAMIARQERRHADA